MTTARIEPTGRPLDARVRPPGSKSYTNRALVIAALAEGTSSLVGGLDADDTVVMRRALGRLGVVIDDSSDPWLVQGSAGRLAAPSSTLDVGASGTTARFLTAAATRCDGSVVIDGTERMRQRPIGPLVDALSRLGADIDSADGCPPVTVRPARMHGGHVEVDMTTSSQFLSAVLLIAPLLGATTVVRIGGRAPVSRPYVANTVEVMRAFGADVTVQGDDIEVEPTGYRSTTYAVEADASAAAYPLAAAAITGGRVVISGLPPDSTQPDLALIDRLGAMGCRTARTRDGLELVGPQAGLRGIDTDMTGAPDAAMALAVVAAFAHGSSRLRGLRTLRMKETDRLAALQSELTRIGAGASIEGDDLVIEPGPLHGASIATYDDHRMAMAFAVAGLVVPGIVIEDPGCVSKTWPEFFDVLESMTALRP